MSILNYKVMDKVTFIVDEGPITEGSVGTIKAIKGCNCKPNKQVATIEVDGLEYQVSNFRDKITLKERWLQ